MSHTIKILALPLLLCAGSLAEAAPGHKVCVPAASGVPTMEGPPHWTAAWGGVQSTELDDPRWLGATTQAFGLGSAMAPLQGRAVWANEGGQDYLYLSFISNVDATVTSPSTTPRDFYLGFRRPTPLGGQRGYIFQFHLGNPGVAGPVAPTYCEEDCPLNGDYWRVFVDNGNYGVCGATGGSGAKYEVMPVPVQNPPVTIPLAWMADAVHFWKLGSGGVSFLQNRWAVQMRLPLAADDAAISAGIARNLDFWYEATAQLGGVEGAAVSLGWWPRGGLPPMDPRELSKSICPQTSSIPNALIHEELGTFNATSCPGCNPDRFSDLAVFSGARPGDCDGGVGIDAIGNLFEAAGGTDFTTASVVSRFKALKPDGTPGVNTVIGRVHNTGPAINAPILARFRLAGWGAAPWSIATDHGKWKDMRGAEAGVCGNGTAPACTATSIATGGKAAIKFQWQLGDDGAIGPSEYCQYGLTPPATVIAAGGACGACTCATEGTCDATTDTGVRWTGPRPAGGAWSCVSRRYGLDQCMLVELSAPNGGVQFTRQSSWNNMSFGQMSVFEREALIDARGLPKDKNQTAHDIYLLVMPRNMPRALPGGATTGNQLVAQQAFEAAERITAGHQAGYDATPEEKRRMIAERYQQPIPTPDQLKKDPRVRLFGERFIKVAQVRPIMPPAEYQRVGKLLDLVQRASDEKTQAEQLTQEVVDVAGPSAAAEIVPTLEIYAYHRPAGGGLVYRPMTSFSVFLSHQGAMNGITWEIDGATRVGENIFHLEVPVDHARRIRVRSQAIEPNEPIQPRGDARWPCGGCCGSSKCGLVGGLNNMTPTLLGGLFFLRRRKKKAGDGEATEHKTGAKTGAKA